MAEATVEASEAAGKKPLSRGEFLKSMFVWAMVPGAMRLSKLLVSKEKESSPKMETGGATYYPIYERHDRGGITQVLMERLAKFEKIDLLFHEWLAQSDIYLSWTPGGLLRTGWKTVIADKEKDLGRVFSDRVLDALAVDHTGVFHEAVSVTKEQLKKSELVQGVEQFIGVALPAGQAMRMIKKGVEGEELRNDFKLLFFFLGMAAWAEHRVPEDYITFHDLESMNEENPDMVRRVMDAYTRIMGNLHPEDLTVMFRNLFMARKMRFMAEKFMEQYHRKPNIAYVMGFLHQPVELLLKSKTDLSLFYLKTFYPRKFMKEIIKHNGGAKAMATVRLIPVAENLAGQNVSSDYIDQELFDFLADIEKETEEG